MYATSDPQRSGRTAFPSRRDDRTNNLIHIGTDPFHVRAGDVYDRGYGRPTRYHYRPYGYPYRRCDYYSNYRPAYYPGWHSYAPFYGYSYASVYLTEPYVVQVYDEPIEYTTTTAVQGVPYAPPGNAYTQPTSPPQAPPVPPVEQYQPLEGTTARSVVSEGNTAFNAGRFEEARRLYIRAVLADERDGYAKMLYAWANFAMGDFTVSASAIRRALLTTSDLIDYPMDLRTLYGDRDLLTAQTDALQRHSIEHGDDAEAQLVLAYLYYSVGEADRAARIFEGLAQRDPADTLVPLVRDAATRASRGQTPPPK